MAVPLSLLHELKGYRQCWGGNNVGQARLGHIRNVGEDAIPIIDLGAERVARAR